MGNARVFKPIEPIPLDLLMEPLIWFFAEHYRHRDVCARLLEAVRSVTCDEQSLREIFNFLDTDLPLHVIDEEDDLFPLLRRRCEPDDQIEKVLGMLSAEHANDMNEAAAVKLLVAAALAEGRGLACYNDAPSIIEPFCLQQKRHIALENAVVLPIARHRLNSEDLRSLGRRLAARRGLNDPFAGTS
ncbi:MAG TPA: hemerythrin domain-containing protein [Hyphomonas sp.]|nr:cation-binding protein [Hyphomonas sp.]HRI99793.1 hemerythrin domain-containing protein [Hyphomonas sp.]